VTYFRSVTQNDDGDDGDGSETMKRSMQEDDDGEDGDNNDGQGQGADSDASSSAQTNGDENALSPYPVCWFEDVETGTPLRWHLFVGVIYDLLCMKTIRSSSTDMKNDTYTHLPWKIRVHFTSYPSLLLPLSPSSNAAKDDLVLQCLFQHYLNSLKQSLYVQHNTNRISKNMSKQSHLQLWDGIVMNHFGVYEQIVSELDGTDGGSGLGVTMENIPLRVLVDDRPAFIRPCKLFQNNGNDSVDADAERNFTSVENVLRDWLPHLFEGESEFLWRVQGIQVPLDCPLLHLWRGLCHPDRFLYITVVT